MVERIFVREEFVSVYTEGKITFPSSLRTVESAFHFPERERVGCWPNVPAAVVERQRAGLLPAAPPTAAHVMLVALSAFLTVMEAIAVIMTPKDGKVSRHYLRVSEAVEK